MECPPDHSQCVQNCSAIAIELYNLTASHGNCKISSTVDGMDSDDIYGCYIGPCSTDSPGLCTVPSTAEDIDEVTCCCTEDYCNTNFADSPTTSTTNIYPYFPNHTTPGIAADIHSITI